MPSIIPVVLSGGSGTRLWPLSRAMYPKQFVRFSNHQSASFLAATLQRLTPERGFEPPIIVCNNDHRFLVRDEAERTGLGPRAILLEPVARNTAPAIAAAALLIARTDADAIIAVMPSDHVIKDEARFVAAVRRAAEVAEAGKLALFGIAPGVPHTGYGYIQRGEPLPGFDGAFAVRAFTEKPDQQTAQNYLASGEYYWNSGIFVLGARAFLRELERLEPSVLAAAEAALAGRARISDFAGWMPQHSRRLPAFRSTMRSWSERTWRRSCRSTSAGAMWAPGRRSGSSATGTGKATRCMATLCSKRQRTVTSTQSERWSRPSASRTSSSSIRQMRCWLPTRPERRTWAPSSPALGRKSGRNMRA